MITEKELRHRIELAILGRTSNRAADAVMALLSELTASKPWSDPDSDPVGDIRRFVEKSRESWAL